MWNEIRLQKVIQCTFLFVPIPVQNQNHAPGNIWPPLWHQVQNQPNYKAIQSFSSFILSEELRESSEHKSALSHPVPANSREAHGGSLPSLYKNSDNSLNTLEETGVARVPLCCARYDRQHKTTLYLSSLGISNAGESQVTLLPVWVDTVALKLPQLKRSMKGLGVNLDGDGIDNNKHPLHDLFSKAIFTAKRRSLKVITCYHKRPSRGRATQRETPRFISNIRTT